MSTPRLEVVSRDDQLDEPPRDGSNELKDRGPHGPHGPNRRAFLKYLLAFAGGAVTSAIAVDALTDRGDIDPDPQRLHEILQAGFAENWRDVTLFPGIIVASPDTMVSSLPTLDDAVTLESLNVKNAQRLVMLRPFHVQPTLYQHVVELAAPDLRMLNNTPIKDSTLAFWLPWQNSLMYASYEANLPHLQAHSRVPGEYGTVREPRLYAQTILLDGHKNVGGHPYAYIEYEDVDIEYNDTDYTDRTVTRTTGYRLCGASHVYNSDAQVMGVVEMFSDSSNRQEPFTLPE